MDRTPGTSDAPFLVKLLVRLKGALHAPRRHNVRQLVVLADGVPTLNTLMIAAFHENWNIRRALSPADATALLRKAPSAALVYDWDSRKGDWRGLCSACVECGVPFHLLATTPSDDLFLAVAAAGGASVLWKPFSSEQIIAAISFASSLDRTAHNDARDAAGDAAMPSARLGGPDCND